VKQNAYVTTSLRCHLAHSPTQDALECYQTPAYGTQLIIAVWSNHCTGLLMKRRMWNRYHIHSQRLRFTLAAFKIWRHHTA